MIINSKTFFLCLNICQFMPEKVSSQETPLYSKENVNYLHGKVNKNNNNNNVKKIFFLLRMHT